ncbi:putative bifunctional diguanylate cyclase/phosphodiesterase [Rhizobium sp. Rhizsp82]|uniref:putative bifunctional diguanylate cyclase/phosphodiesterase n=1 Tax=Rhizobium sp. Rhizsp82 TaxID=3243057 RepID=UPI0039B4832D
MENLLRDREARFLLLSKRLDLTLQASGVGSWEFHPFDGAMVWDDRMREIFGITALTETLGYEHFRAMVHPEDLGLVEDALSAAFKGTMPLRGEFRIFNTKGELRFVRAHGIVHTLEDGERILIGANWDITSDVLAQQEARAAEEKAKRQNDELHKIRAELEFQALHDSLTGLANRRSVERDPASFFGSLGQKDVIACLHVDLDRFKSVNDTGGHSLGDAVLRIMAARLKAICSESDLIARTGGDEFIILRKCETDRGEVTATAAAIVAACREPVEVGRRGFRLGASVGVAFQTASASLGSLISDADIALYEAKRRGGGRYAVFSQRLRERAVGERELAEEVLSGLERSEFIPFFQPQVDAKTRKIVGAEALARWSHPYDGILPPTRFLPAAEQVGRLGDLDGMVLVKALAAFDRWQEDGVPIPRISVNVSAQRLKDDDFPKMLGLIGNRAGVLSFELLESISFDERDVQLSQAVERIRDLGIQIELDDFGTGHASIVSLMDLRPDRLKIDRKLVAPIVNDLAQRALLASLIDIAKALKIEVIAEGVETNEHADILEGLGCDVLQGYLFSPPVTADEIGRMALVLAGGRG